MDIEREDNIKVTLEELKQDVEAARSMFSQIQPCFTYITVASLINVIERLSTDRIKILYEGREDVIRILNNIRIVQDKLVAEAHAGASDTDEGEAMKILFKLRTKKLLWIEHIIGTVRGIYPRRPNIEEKS